MKGYSTEPETSSRAIIGLRDTSSVANRLWNCTLRPKYGVIGDEPILEYSIRRCVLHASLKIRLSRVAIIAGAARRSGAIKSLNFTLAYFQPDSRRSLNAILRNKYVSRSEEPKRPAALNRCLVTLEWHSKVPNAATSAAPVLIEISVPRARLPAIRSRHFPLKTTETVTENRGLGWGSFRAAIYHGVLFLDVSRDLRSVLITVHHDRART